MVDIEVRNNRLKLGIGVELCNDFLFLREFCNILDELNLIVSPEVLTSTSRYK